MKYKTIFHIRHILLSCKLMVEADVLYLKYILRLFSKDSDKKMLFS